MECEDGAELSRGQKLLLFILADYHQPENRRAWRSLPELAKEALTSLSTVKRDLAYLEEHCTLARVRPETQGRGDICHYIFLRIDDSARLGKLLVDKAKGVQNEPLFLAERGPEGIQKGSKSDGKRGSEGVQIGDRNKERTKNYKTQQENEELSTAVAALKPGSDSLNATPEGKRALKIWLLVKSQLEKQLPADEVKLWVKPARLQRVMHGIHMLIALPPSNRIMQAATARRDLLRELLGPHKFSASFVKYADEYEIERAREEFGIEVQQYGR